MSDTLHIEQGITDALVETKSRLEHQIFLNCPNDTNSSVTFNVYAMKTTLNFHYKIKDQSLKSETKLTPRQFPQLDQLHHGCYSVNILLIKRITSGIFGKTLSGLNGKWNGHFKFLIQDLSLSSGDGHKLQYMMQLIITIKNLMTTHRSLGGHAQQRKKNGVIFI